jgi:hypothetical protein
MKAEALNRKAYELLYRQYPTELSKTQQAVLEQGELNQVTKEYFNIMETNAQRGSALVKQILTFARGFEG